MTPPASSHRRPLHLVLRLIAVPDSQHSSGTSPLCIVPGHAVKGVEIAGGGARALEALASSDPTARGSSGRSQSLDLGSLLIRRDPPLHHPPHAAAGSFARGRTSPPLPSERANRRGLSAAFDAEAEAVASLAIEAGDRGGGGGRGTTDAKEDASASDDSAAMTASDARRLSARYRRVREALEAARVPVQEVAGGEGGVVLGGAEDGGAGFGFGARDAPTLVVMGCVRISAPYTADACACANAVVLARVRAIVEEAAAGAA